jgi:sigma factor-binding protein Crl
MAERVTHLRLLRKFAALGPYVREAQCHEGNYRFDCFAVCVSAKPAPEQREFWGWWLELEQQDHHFRYHYQFGCYNRHGLWVSKPTPKKHQAELAHSLRHFYGLLNDCLSQLECQLSPSVLVSSDNVITAA